MRVPSTYTIESGAGAATHRNASRCIATRSAPRLGSFGAQTVDIRSCGCIRSWWRTAPDVRWFSGDEWVRQADGASLPVPLDADVEEEQGHRVEVGPCSPSSDVGPPR